MFIFPPSNDEYTDLLFCQGITSILKKQQKKSEKKSEELRYFVALYFGLAL
jgi:hypothetical protein